MVDHDYSILQVCIIHTTGMLEVAHAFVAFDGTCAPCNEECQSNLCIYLRVLIVLYKNYINNYQCLPPHF